ncbi:lactate dehydrogenase [Pseudomonadales bacterium]|nr:lactate dehydrogenase [Pseudomonadales bacterium]
MNAVEIEQAISELAEQPFDSVEFPFQFLQAFGNKETTLKKLRTGNTNKSDLGGVLQTNNIHIVVCAEGEVSSTLEDIKNSLATKKAKVKYALATDGVMFEAEELSSEEQVACEFDQFHDHFGFFLGLAGISTVKAIRENSFDVKATSRLDRLYVQLLKENPEWAASERREEMNHFMARLIFCFFSEDTSIFAGDDLFTNTVNQMSERDSSNTHDVIGEIFRAMNTPIAERNEAEITRWANQFPYVNGGLFAGSTECPKFSKIAKAYLLKVGQLDWTKINPDIFGSMIQAVADDEERGELGMHYTSVPNILKVLNPLFLDELREALEEAGDNARKLLNLRKRISRIRVFDPACGSGNFLVIAYKELRAIENELNERRDERGRKTEIPLTNFRGIEIRGFSAEVARLALIIAEYQCDVAYLGQQEALIEFLPLSSENWITCGNALRLDWLSVCPPTGSAVKHVAEDLFEETHQQFEVDFENEGGETFICGNPPYKGSKWQSPEQKADLSTAWQTHPSLAKNTDYVSGWLAKFLTYQRSEASATAAFVTTNSICQGQQASEIWPVIFEENVELNFAKLPFKWSNLASHNAGVTVIVIGLANANKREKQLFYDDQVRKCSSISPYLIPDSKAVVTKAEKPLSERARMLFGNMPRDGGYLFLSKEEAHELLVDPNSKDYVKAFLGSEELINGKMRYCLWIEDEEVRSACKNALISSRLKSVEETRLASKAKSTRDFAARSHRFVQIAGKAVNDVIVVPRVSSENRNYLPVDYRSAKYVIGDRNFALYDAPLSNMALIASRLHWVWIGTVCVRLEMRFSYSNTLGWNTFPVPTLTEKNKEDLTRCAENILLAREAHFPKTIADLYDPEKMPENLRQAHEENDEVLERIYIGRRFRNDTERLEKLFDMYTKMTANTAA